MFEHLDDPCPPPLGDGLLARVGRAATRRRARNRVATVGAGLTLSTVGGAMLLRVQAGQVDRITVGGLGPVTEPPTPGSSPQGSSVPAVAPVTAAVNVVLAGWDGPRDGVTGRRGDTIAIVRLDPAAGQVRLLSIPRDLYVNSDSGAGRINEFTGRPSELVTVIEQTFAIPLQHFVAVDFEGFAELIDLAGGVAMPFERPARDTHTGFEVNEPGCRVLDGEQALAYVRSRYWQEYDATSDTWVADPTSDFGWVARQQDFVARLYRQVLTADYGTLDLIGVLTDVLDDVTVDESLSVGRIRELFATAQSIGPDGFVTYDLSGAVGDDRVNGSAVLRPDPEAVAAVVHAFLTGADAPLLSGPADAAVAPAGPTCP